MYNNVKEETGQTNERVTSVMLNEKNAYRFSNLMDKSETETFIMDIQMETQQN